MNFTFLKFFNYKGLFISRIIQVLLLISGLSYLFSQIKTRFELKVGHSAIFYLSIYFTLFLFLLTINKAETWFWYCASFTYLWSIIALIAVIAALIGINRFSYLVLAISSVYISGASAPLILMMLMFYVIIGFRHKDMIIKILFSTALLLIGFLILYSGPGNLERESYFDDISILNTFWINSKSIIKIIIFKILPLSPFIAIFLLPIIFIRIPEKIKIMLNNVSISGVSFFFIVLLFFHHLPIAYKIQDIAPDRAMAPFSIYLIIYLIIIGTKLNSRISLNEHNRSKMLHASLILVFFITSITFYSEYKIAKNYTQAFDQRISQIEAGCDDNILELQPLPESGWIMSSEIETDQNHWKNQHLKNAYNLDCELMLSH